MTEAELKDIIKRQLGEPVVCSELEDAHYDQAISNAKRWFLAKKGVLGMKSITITQGERKRFSDIDPTYGVYKIIDVVFDIDPNLSTLYYECYYDIYPYGVPLIYGSQHYLTMAGQYSAFAQILQSLEQRRRVFGSEPDWFTMPSDAFDGNDFFYIDGIRNRAATVVVVYKPNMSAAQMNLSLLRARDVEMFERYALADAREILGYIRGKYRTYPAAGGTIDTDADTLLEAARTEKEKLDEEIGLSQGGFPGLIAG